MTSVQDESFDPCVYLFTDEYCGVDIKLHVVQHRVALHNSGSFHWILSITSERYQSKVRGRDQSEKYACISAGFQALSWHLRSARREIFG